MRRFIELANGIPSHDTFNRVLSRFDVNAWQQCFMNWVNAVSEGATGRTIRLGGKTARASRDTNSAQAAFDAQHGRYETRSASVIQEVSLLEAYGFPGLSSLVRLEAEREQDGKVSHSIRYTSQASSWMLRRL